MNLEEQLMQDMKAEDISKTIQESFNFFGALTPWLGEAGFLPSKDGTVWNVVAGGGGVYPPQANILLYIIESQYYNRLQRWLARYIVKMNSYALSAITNLSTLVLGHDYKIVSETDAGQRRIDDWWGNQGNENYPDYSGRAVEAFERFLIDGEVFLRIFGTGPGSKVRFTDPDLVYASDESKGIKMNPQDYEVVEGYMVNSSAWKAQYANAVSMADATMVPAKEMQHRKNAYSNERRGFSYILPIYQSLINADALLNSITVCARSQAKFVANRQWDADAQAVATVRAQIQSSTNAVSPPFVPPNVPQPAGAPPNMESYADGTIVDTPKGMTFDLMNTSIQGEEYVIVLRAILRQVASRFGLPEAILSQDQDSMAAYTAALVSNSYLVKAMERYQQQIWNWDKMLLEKCGMDTKDLHPSFAEVAVPDKKHLVDLATFLKKEKLASNCTIDKMFDIDYEAEQATIREEFKEVEGDPALGPAPDAEVPGAEGEAKNTSDKDNQDAA